MKPTKATYQRSEWFQRRMLYTLAACYCTAFRCDLWDRTNWRNNIEPRLS